MLYAILVLKRSSVKKRQAMTFTSTTKETDPEVKNG
jgi:hypothetical protein